MSRKAMTEFGAFNRSCCFHLVPVATIIAMVAAAAAATTTTTTATTATATTTTTTTYRVVI